MIDGSVRFRAIIHKDVEIYLKNSIHRRDLAYMFLVFREKEEILFSVMSNKYSVLIAERKFKIPCFVELDSRNVETSNSPRSWRRCLVSCIRCIAKIESLQIQAVNCSWR